MSWRRPGLQAQLVVVLSALAFVAAVAASAAVYLQARNNIFSAAQDQILNGFADTIDAASDWIGPEPTRRELAELTIVGDGSVARSGNVQVGSWPFDVPDPPQALLNRVEQSPMPVFQRESGHAVPLFYVAGQIRNDWNSEELTQPVLVTAVYNLAQAQSQIDSLERRAAAVAAVVAVLGALIGLWMARRLVLPLRQLNAAAASLVPGTPRRELTAAAGHELAELVSTFNRTAAELDRTVADLAAKEADARRFVADVFHELRTPLAALVAVAEILEDDAASMEPDTARAARIVSRGTERLSRLTEDVIEISRFDTGRADLDLHVHDLTELTRESLGTRGFEDRVRLIDGTPVRCTVDRRRLDIVIGNLVANALAHGRPPVVMTVTGDDETAVLSVTDHGPPIPDDQRRRLFERFYKADASRGDTEGSGIGLALVEENVTLHGGTITVTSGSGGNTFTVRLPRLPPLPGHANET
ncbi:two-component system sensor histidine kinase MtrB [Rhodococcus sp. AG1013]|uniref:sensor histidine kinase n=1 Tax=Rhodococcus sp. AG1013 TaxID=2183996 RepID=UPI000E0BA3ED|nr:HAMP domain-containing sensor histidine kinase [Rhodococcus sp. AG1013]RDI16694.1 two-component system sensor histidine kinase MtrB [Rhodococcus sp. AG1013]